MKRLFILTSCRQSLCSHLLRLSLAILLAQSFAPHSLANDGLAEEILVSESSVSQGLDHKSTQYHFVSVENSAVQTIGKIVFQQICYKTQLHCYIDMLPAIRAERSMRDATLTGEVMRVWDYGVDNPQFLRVPTPYYRIRTAMFVRADSQYKINGAADLAPLTIGALEGVKHSQAFAKMGVELINASSTEQLMKLLTKGRIDVAIASYTDGLEAINHMQAEHLTVLPTILSAHPTYVYIHPNYADLVPIFDDAIKALIKSGEIEAITTQAEAVIFNKRG